MTRNRKIFMAAAAALSGFVLLGFLVFRGQPAPDGERHINPVRENIALTTVTTGLVQPQNRLEIKPSIGGRIEEILVREGDAVKAGQVLARMSSVERAALIDAARLESKEVLEYWEEVYRKSPVIAPIDGDVIARYMEPGQTVSAADTILVLSDRLVIKAQFDETDIGRVDIGQPAVIVLDAYPDIRLDGAVDHIAYESELISNVTIYNVDILTEGMPKILRSGMNVTVELTEKVSKDALTVPSAAVHRDGGRTFVRVKDRAGRALEKDVEIGIDNNDRAEILSGIGPDDRVVIRGMSELPGRRTAGTNPFLPSRRR